jgi:hypothetical protein
LSARKREVFEKLGLAEDDDATLSNRLDRMTEYRELEKRLTELRARESGLVSRLADVPELRDLDREALEAQAQELTRQAQGKDELTDRIAEIRARVDAAQRKRDLEEALASRDQARDELGRCGDQAVEAAAGQFLVESLRGEQQSEHQPAVLQRAGDWFGRFTRGRYDLRVSGGASESGEFRAIDNTHQRGLGLEELSGGTRMQLLLAVRLAFAAEAEKDLKLPLVLDEALSTTDPVRFRAVIECLTVLMGQGRQVFYLTCQPGDAAAWEQVVGDQGLGDAKVFDLARVRALQQPAGQLLSRSAAMAETIPAPAGRSLDQYAADLGVPAFDAGQGVAGLHVAHVVDDAESLHRLLQAGIERYGQLEALISRRRVDAYLPAEAQARALARGSVIGAVCEAWKIGRGRPVTREALEEAGVSERFIDRVADLARELEGDAQRLVAALEAREDDRAKGFRSAALSEVCENLEAEGYLDSRQPLASEAALTRVLTAVNADVKAGAITVEQVRVLFQRFWSAATGE